MFELKIKCEEVLHMKHSALLLKILAHENPTAIVA